MLKFVDIILPENVKCTVGETTDIEAILKNHTFHTITNLKVSVASARVSKIGSKELVMLKKEYAKIMFVPEQLAKRQSKKIMIKVKIPKDYGETALNTDGNRIEVAPILKFMVRGIKEIKSG